MGRYVKNTILDALMATVAPHYCCGCGKTGTLLCDNCKYNIISESYDGCVACGRATTKGVCADCKTAYSRAWCVGERDDALKVLIDGYKFSRKKASARELALLLHHQVAMLPPSTIVTAVPTVGRHIRMRGYDHAELLAKEFARLRGLHFQRTLYRTTKTRQRGANRTTRLAQAKTAFAPMSQVQTAVPYLLVDDVVTTGASLHYAAQTLRNAGAAEVWVAVVARQPLK